ncbi:epidermal growth factor-like protein 7 isoform X1 [Tympanuchus pallidicinctus]|uniref:epidermal growth factor-like protein 7 isoform X1 n=1 Tax=Tympanuchus pallidicinctus TaxID=109042 RepID=UPI0022876028|nr:epidermal growth factor-like protein 7 isoform X1 [Tympanuchus pallidicinctus]XP_052524025.1 epidermal growth factor-like protein 7 isoform X1 [Tympanuchus pallidicinctus]
MRRISCLLSGLAIILSATSTDSFTRVGRRTCAAEPRSRTAARTESHVQPVYLPYLTTCQGHRLCSTYRTIYKVAYRQVYKQVPQPVASCCPGWSRTSSYEISCNTALCQLPCQNGGRCTFPGRCACPPGWMGPSCQTDADECASRSHGCSQLCVNTAGSFHCACWDGFSLAADNKACQPVVPGPEPGTFSQADPSSEMKEEMKDLKNRVEALEQKLQLVLAPFHNLMPSAPEDVGTDPISRLSHSLQQLDRIDSLSEQISFLEERLETCKCLQRGGVKHCTVPIFPPHIQTPLTQPQTSVPQLCSGLFVPRILAVESRCKPARSVTHISLLILIFPQTQQPVINKR